MTPAGGRGGVVMRFNVVMRFHVVPHVYFYLFSDLNQVASNETSKHGLGWFSADVHLSGNLIEAVCCAMLRQETT